MTAAGARNFGNVGVRRGVVRHLAAAAGARVAQQCPRRGLARAQARPGSTARVDGIGGATAWRGFSIARASHAKVNVGVGGRCRGRCCGKAWGLGGPKKASSRSAGPLTRCPRRGAKVEEEMDLVKSKSLGVIAIGLEFVGVENERREVKLGYKERLPHGGSSEE